MGVPSIEISKKRERKERNLPLQTWSVSLFWGCERGGEILSKCQATKFEFLFDYYCYYS